MVIEEYYFLFAIALIWAGFAGVQDIRKREVANWLSFSLIAGVLFYRLFYSIGSGNWMFFVYGLASVGFFAVIGLGMYYMRGFGGGDVKLLIGLGGILPVYSVADVFLQGAGFFLLMFLIGAIYSILVSGFIAVKRFGNFRVEFMCLIKKWKWVLMGLVVFAVILWFVNVNLSFLIIFVILACMLFVYLVSVDRCLLVLKSPGSLEAGEWLEKEVSVRGKTIGKSVHGLSWRDIYLLRKANRKVWIKEGIAFVPAIFISLLVTLFYALVLGVLPFELVLSLFERVFQVLAF